MDRGIIAASPELHRQAIEVIAAHPELLVLD
jgi:hypothetical protein